MEMFGLEGWLMKCWAREGQGNLVVAEQEAGKWRSRRGLSEQKVHRADQKTGKASTRAERQRTEKQGSGGMRSRKRKGQKESRRETSSAGFTDRRGCVHGKKGNKQLRQFWKLRNDGMVWQF